MLAKRFFYVCVGILMVALAYLFGASNRRAEASGSSVSAAGLDPLGSFVATDNGDVYFGLYPVSGSGARWSLMGNVGSAAPVVAIQGELDNWVHACASDGRFYVSPDNGHT